MSDVIDEAQAYSEAMLSAALSHRKNSLPFVGRCHHCSYPLREGSFCGPLEDGSPSYCREDYESLKRNKR